MVLSLTNHVYLQYKAKGVCSMDRSFCSAAYVPGGLKSRSIRGPGSVSEGRG